ncbi:MAG TPA: hypothetical protein VH277_02785 [Gemmatimonadaceae bacterium]|jgi:hypothetical protein|nr:hypothetical protein [Gemmatimonadaceae bacterium]
MTIDHVANIGPRGARRRLIGGYVWAAIAAAAFVVLVVQHAPRWFRILLAIPIALSAIGFLQAREKT